MNTITARIAATGRRLILPTRRAVALWKMRSIEINLAAMVELYPKIEDMETRLEMHRAIRVASKSLAEARAEYHSFLPPGDRRVWDLA